MYERRWHATSRPSGDERCAECWRAMMSTHQTAGIEAVRSIYDGFNKQDIATVLGAVTPDFVLVDIPTGQSFHGPDGFLQWLQPFMVALPDSQTEVTRIIDGGEWIAAEHTGRGTHSGPL